MWGINRLLTKLRHPPKFHGSVLFHIVSEAPTQGVLLAFVPSLLTVVFIWCWFAENSFMASSDPVASPSAINFEGITGYERSFSLIFLLCNPFFSRMPRRLALPIRVNAG